MKYNILTTEKIQNEFTIRRTFYEKQTVLASVLISAVLSISCLEVATPTRRPFSGRCCHALTWLSNGHSLTAYL